MKTKLLNAVSVSVIAGLLILSGSARAADATKLVVGTGLSQAADPKEAGTEAAKKALAALGGQPAKIVIFFHNNGAKGCLDGINSVFDPAIVYGANSYDPITQDGNTGKVGVLALGGNIEIDTAMAKLEANNFADCGKQIGDALKAASEKKVKGRLMLLFGECHVPNNDALTKGVCGVLGEKFPVIGGAAHIPAYFKGKALEGKHNMGLLISGDFSTGLAIRNADAKDKAATIACAGEAFKEAIGDKKDKVALMFAMDCGGRRGTMGAEIPQELAAMKAVCGTVPIFGFYGSGETGHKNNTAPSCGVGYSIVACAVIVE